MAEISIWRWAMTDDLDALFARLVGADEQGFAQIAQEMSLAGEEDLPSLDQIEAETEAKFRAMNLPPDILDTMLKGFRAQMQEAREDETAYADEGDAGFAPDPEGRQGLALASSHMFFDDPFASLEHVEIEGQIEALTSAYRAALSKALGDGGQPLGAVMGFREERLFEDAVFDALMETGLDAVLWVWVTPEVVWMLSQWQEDKELPIDLDVSRMPRVAFDRAKARVAAVL